MLGLGPPRLRRPAAGSARRPCLRLGLRSRPGPLGLRPAGPRLGPPPPGAGRARALALVVGFRRCPRLRGALGLSAGRLRPSARPRGSPGGSRCGGPGPCGRRPCRAARCGPLLGGSGPGGSCRLPRPLGALRFCRLPACAPSLVAPGPLARGPLGGPASAVGRRASSLRGRLGGGYAAPLSRRRPLRWGLGPGARATSWGFLSRVKINGPPDLTGGPPLTVISQGRHR